MYFEIITMRTNIVLDDKLIKEASSLTGVTIKRELVDIALRELIRSKRKKNLFDLTDQLELADNYDHKSMRDLRNGTD